ncbi:hypothetical protein ABZ135_28645 [Streptomyces sp. NPDC006339]|uniref:WXG100 family type VII secretion target n=1 Tax=Streptomyces sp. NPDC006339 TaxID=3156755 RepID=UPI0033A416D8
MSGEFEGKSLDALYAMIASAKPEEITSTGEALAAAVPKILDIAADLRHYISRVQWEGEGAEAFRKWGAGMVSETLVLGDFTKVVSEEMKRAGAALREAKSSVPKPAGMCFADPEKEKARQEAETGPKLREAIAALERLSSYYTETNHRISSERQPEFKPMGGSIADMESEYGSGSGTGGYASSSTGSSAGSTESNHSSLRRAEESITTSGGDRQIRDERITLPPTAPTRPPESEIDTNLDSVTITPDAPTKPAVQPPPVQPPTTNGPQPVVLPPVAPPLGPQTNPQIGPQGRTSHPGLPGPAGRSNPFTPSPLGTGPRPEGITGGRQVPGRPGMTPPMGRPPMATVIGEERASQYGRGAAGLHGPGAIGPGAPAGGPGAGAGRRLATQPGGTVGGPSASGVTGRSAFTPGGTGLVRPPASTEPGQEERRQSRRRPDYLSEDEETWNSGQRPIVPPVID